MITKHLPPPSEISLNLLAILIAILLLSSVGCGSSRTGSGALVSNPQFQSDPNNCGSAHHVCGGTQPGCCGGSCTDLAGDTSNCGSCGGTCSTSCSMFGDPSCSASSSGAGGCSSSDLTWQGGIVCLGGGVASEGQSCTFRYCGCQCNDGATKGTCYDFFHTCPGQCDDLCANHGGQAQSCDTYTENDFLSQCTYLNSAPPRGCPSGYASCSGKCLYTGTDSNNCGACGNVCPANKSYCVNGVCGSCTFDSDCSNGNTCSNGTCVCGSGTACAGLNQCSSGQCLCNGSVCQGSNTCQQVQEPLYGGNSFNPTTTTVTGCYPPAGSAQGF